MARSSLVGLGLGHQCGQVVTVGQFTLGVQVAAQCTATDCQHRVFDGCAIDQAAHGLDLGVGEAAGLQHPVRRHDRVEARDRQVLRPQQHLAGQRGGGGCDMGRHPGQRPHQPQRRGGRLDQSPAHQRQASRCRIGKPGAGWAIVRRRTAVVEQQGAELAQALQPHCRQMCLQQHGKAAYRQIEKTVQTFDDVQLPQRPVPIQGPRMDARDLDAKLPPVARLGQRDVTDVVFEIEVLIVHPVRVVQPQRHGLQALAKQRRRRQPPLDVRQHRLEPHHPASRGRLVKNVQQADVGVRGRGVRVEVPRVVPAELAHGDGLPIRRRSRRTQRRPLARPAWPWRHGAQPGPWRPPSPAWQQTCEQPWA